LDAAVAEEIINADIEKSNLTNPLTLTPNVLLLCLFQIETMRENFNVNLNRTANRRAPFYANGELVLGNLRSF